MLSTRIPLTDDDIEEIDTDCCLVTLVIDEVPVNVVEAIVRDGGKRDFMIPTPKGYIRSINDSSGAISLLEELKKIIMMI